MQPRDVARAICDALDQQHNDELDADIDARNTLPDGLVLTAYSGGSGQVVERFEIRITKVSG